ncbi:uncharacterized protein LOC124655945 [Lolium rigidum]|uniref:uncharacterized protein LOC124655945 n=1 Tax=Lolium rigidum TaxID=89674 RepID=UPI001F5D8F64|nr:uncharacterized protein LOC124655945 [Lolium rigidum]
MSPPTTIHRLLPALPGPRFVRRRAARRRQPGCSSAAARLAGVSPRAAPPPRGSPESARAQLRRLLPPCLLRPRLSSPQTRIVSALPLISSGHSRLSPTSCFKPRRVLHPTSRCPIVSDTAREPPPGFCCCPSRPGVSPRPDNSYQHLVKLCPRQKHQLSSRTRFSKSLAKEEPHGAAARTRGFGEGNRLVLHRQYRHVQKKSSINGGRKCKCLQRGNLCPPAVTCILAKHAGRFFTSLVEIDIVAGSDASTMKLRRLYCRCGDGQKIIPRRHVIME